MNTITSLTYLSFSGFPNQTFYNLNVLHLTQPNISLIASSKGCDFTSQIVYSTNTGRVVILYICIFTFRLVSTAVGGPVIEKGGKKVYDDFT